MEIIHWLTPVLMELELTSEISESVECSCKVVTGLCYTSVLLSEVEFKVQLIYDE